MLLGAKLGGLTLWELVPLVLKQRLVQEGFLLPEEDCLHENVYETQHSRVKKIVCLDCAQEFASEAVWRQAKEEARERLLPPLPEDFPLTKGHRWDMKAKRCTVCGLEWENYDTAAPKEDPYRYVCPPWRRVLERMDARKRAEKGRSEPQEPKVKVYGKPPPVDEFLEGE